MLGTIPTHSIVHVVILYLYYFHCLTMVHGMAFQNENWTTLGAHPQVENSSVNEFWRSAQLCMAAARISLKTVKLLPHGDYACIWYVHIL